MPDIRELIGKEVELFANGVSYRGTLVEVSDSDVYLKSPIQWISLPVEAVGHIKPASRLQHAFAEVVEEPEEITDRDFIEVIDDAEASGSA